jgi:hypothetical protein
MFTRCLFCHRELPANESLERFPIGRRVAYDPARRRLWAVCPSCRRWNLAPIEERWEALEEQALTAVGVGGVLALMARGLAGGASIFGGRWLLGRAGRQLPKASRTLKFGRTAWQGRALCPRCGTELVRIPFKTRGSLIALPDDRGELALSLRCLNCEYGRGNQGVRAALIASMPASTWSMLGTGMARCDEKGRITAKIWMDRELT